MPIYSILNVQKVSNFNLKILSYYIWNYSLPHLINLSIRIKKVETKEVININQDVANFLTLSLIVLHRLKTPSFLSNSFSLLSNVGRVKVKKPHLSHSVLFLPPTKLATRKLLLVYSTLLKKLHDKILIMYCKLCFVLCSCALLKNALQSVRTNKKKSSPHKTAAATARWIQLSCPCFLSSWTGFSVISTLISKHYIKELKTKIMHFCITLIGWIIYT